jgi:hypothetical protein
MDRYEKAQKLYEEGSVYFRGRIGEQLFFLVKGRLRKVYEVKRDNRGKLKYHCNCDYIGLDDCSHKIACQIYASKNHLLWGEDYDK